ncbi:MAG: alpha/beta hydrolase [Cyanobacteria bacterium REEB459]|nr:alpha/beta hydrolase [Cyanobacteria bacterium REEB459]
MQILLIHGLARTSLSLLNLEQSLKQLGHSTEQFSYFAFAETFDTIANRLAQRLQRLGQQGPYAVVAHSLGGLLTRAALGQGEIGLPHHVIMLGTPNQPPRLARLAWQLPPFRWFTGQCGLNLTSPAFYAQLPPLANPYTIVAGTGGPRGSLSPFGHEVNDGIVALSETAIISPEEVLQVPAWHTFMMNHPQVWKIVKECLKRA